MCDDSDMLGSMVDMDWSAGGTIEAGSAEAERAGLALVQAAVGLRGTPRLRPIEPE